MTLQTKIRWSSDDDGNTDRETAEADYRGANLLGSSHVYIIEPIVREKTSATASAIYRHPFRSPVPIFHYLLE